MNENVTQKRNRHPVAPSCFSLLILWVWADSLLNALIAQRLVSMIYWLETETDCSLPSFHWVLTQSRIHITV